MKKTLAFLLAMIMAISVISSAPAEEPAYTVLTAPVMHGSEQTGTMDLRFYSAAPNVAYYGLREYISYLQNVELTVTELENGDREIVNPNGSAIRVSPSAGTVAAPDWASFQFPSVPYTTMIGVKDSSCIWSYYSDLVFDDAPNPVVFDFAKYGIAVYADKDDVYLPLALLSTLFGDIAINYVIFNGETVFRPVLDLNNLTGLPAGYYEGSRMKALMTGEAQRQEDEINESYGELCFIMDYLFGHPGVARIDGAIAEKGLDAALRELPDGAGEKLIEDLHSPDMPTYMLALSRLFFELLDDGHTVFTGVTGILGNNSPFPELTKKILSEGLESILGSSSTAKQQMLIQTRTQRASAWGDDLYRECGSTAIIRLDAFNTDEAGWEAYYAGTGDIPDDAYGLTWKRLKKASENPEIKNILFDLTSNTGGSSDLLMAAINLMTGDNIFRGYNVLTGQHEHAVVHTDKNLDGAIDEKDDEIKYDFNYAVLTTRLAFSCGNLFPFQMQENGAVLLGEPTGGGSCCVQTATLTSGAVFMMSSYMWALRTRDDASLEDGCHTDLVIERIEPETPTNANPKLSAGDYSAYFDDVMLDQMINDWFAEQAEAPAA